VKTAFCIAGVQKGGTTALTGFLRGHPELALSRKRETHFFDHEEFFARKTPPFDIYHRCFDMDGKRFAGETTPAYSYWPATARRIHAYNPEMKLIILLRNPVDRAWSHYQMELKRGAEKLPFEQAIGIEKDRRRAVWPFPDRVHSYVDRGFYAPQIERILSVFPESQVLCIKNEDLQRRHHDVLRRVYGFLEVDVGAHMPEPRSIFSQNYDPVPPQTRARLLRSFAPDIARLQEMLGWDCSEWMKPIAGERLAEPEFDQAEFPPDGANSLPLLKRLIVARPHVRRCRACRRAFISIRYDRRVKYCRNPGCVHESEEAWLAESTGPDPERD